MKNAYLYYPVPYKLREELVPFLGDKEHFLVVKSNDTSWRAILPVDAIRELERGKKRPHPKKTNPPTNLRHPYEHEDMNLE